jgi:hypothetical protein
MLEAGVGLMLMREEHVTQGLAHGVLAMSPIASAEFPLFVTHLTSRLNDPLVCTFLAAAAQVWPDMTPTSPHGDAAR